MLGNFTYSNPTKLYFGDYSLAYLNEELPKYGTNVQLIYGGGSVCDYAKAVSASAHCGEDPWEKYYLRLEDVSPNTKIIPVGCILTMAGTGSEMNGGAVITNHEQKLKNREKPSRFAKFYNLVRREDFLFYKVGWSLITIYL